MSTAVVSEGEQFSKLSAAGPGSVNVMEPKDPREGHQEIRDEIDRARERVEDAQLRFSRRLALASPVFALLLCSQAFLVSTFANVIDLPGQQLFDGNGAAAYLADLFAIWAVTAVIASTFYYFVFRPPLTLARRQLSDTRANLRARSRPGRLHYLKDELNRLRGTIAHVFFDNAQRYVKAKEWHTKASEILEGWKGGQGVLIDGETHNLADVEDLVSSIEELVNREERECRQQRAWRNISVVMVLIYTLVLLVLLSNHDRWGLVDRARTVLSIPFSVLLWGGVGSVAAILYKLYTVKDRVNLQDEVRWLIARPIIGVIMSALAFFAVRAGLVLLDVTDPTLLVTDPATLEPDGNRSTAIPDIYLVVAFLAGFSDKFYLAIVNRLIGQVAYREPSALSELHNEQLSPWIAPPSTSLRK